MSNTAINHDLSTLLKAFDKRLGQATVNDNHHHKIGMRVIKACLRQAARDVSGHISTVVEDALVHAIVDNDW
jgi:predicted HD phosphohydrolase